MNTRKIAKLLIRHCSSLAKYKGIYSYKFTLLMILLAKQKIETNLTFEENRAPKNKKENSFYKNAIMVKL